MKKFILFILMVIIVGLCDFLFVRKLIENAVPDIIPLSILGVAFWFISIVLLAMWVFGDKFLDCIYGEASNRNIRR